MRILLPPSEAKKGDGDGPPLAEIGLGPAPLATPRARLARAVVALSARPAVAATALLLPPSVRDDALAANRVVLEAPTMTALDRYDGVLYQSLDAATLTSKQRSLALDSVLIFSGLWGVVGAAELLPLYRVPAAAVLPRIGSVTRFWRTALGVALADLVEEELVVDLRSSDYSAMWASPPAVAAVRVLTESADGTRRAVSHTGKHVKGLLARRLLTQRARCRDLDDIGSAVAALGHRAEIRRLPKGRAALDIIVGP